MAVGSGIAKYSIVKLLAPPQDVCLLSFGMPSKLPYRQNFFLVPLPSRKSVSQKGGGKGAGGKRLRAAERNGEVMHILAYLAGGIILGVALWLRHDSQTTNILYLQLGEKQAPNTFYV
ncbi:hypothetical protein EK904_007945, partial [Melospiza melodia maxima]